MPGLTPAFSAAEPQNPTRKMIDGMAETRAGGGPREGAAKFSDTTDRPVQQGKVRRHMYSVILAQLLPTVTCETTAKT